MELTADDSKGGKKILLPPGQHTARCYGIIDLGTQPGFKGKPTRKVQVSWEVGDVTHTFKEEEGPMPLSIHETYTKSFHKSANLRKHCEDWRGQKYNDGDKVPLQIYMTQPCLMQVINDTGKNGNPYHAFTTLIQLPKKMWQDLVPIKNKLLYLDLNNFQKGKYIIKGAKNADLEVYGFDYLPEWMKEKISESKEYAELISKGVAEVYRKSDSNGQQEQQSTVAMEEEDDNTNFSEDDSEPGF